MSGTLQTPASGSPNSTEDPKIATAISTFNGLLTSGNLLDGAQIGSATVPAAALASNSVTTAKITDANVTDTKLASPNNSVYKTLMSGGGFLGSFGSAITFALCANSTFVSGSFTNHTLLSSSFSITQTTSTQSPSAIANSMIYFDDADYTVGGLTQKLRLRFQVNTNATAWSGVTATAGLYPVTFAGGAGTLTATLGTVVSGSTVALANPSASTTNQGNSGDFTIPSDGQYMLGVAVSAASTANAVAIVSAQLQTRNV